MNSTKSIEERYSSAEMFLISRLIINSKPEKTFDCPCRDRKDLGLDISRSKFSTQRTSR